MSLVLQPSAIPSKEDAAKNSFDYAHLLDIQNEDFMEHTFGDLFSTVTEPFTSQNKFGRFMIEEPLKGMSVVLEDTEKLVPRYDIGTSFPRSVPASRKDLPTIEDPTSDERNLPSLIFLDPNEVTSPYTTPPLSPISPRSPKSPTSTDYGSYSTWSTDAQFFCDGKLLPPSQAYESFKPKSFHSTSANGPVAPTMKPAQQSRRTPQKQFEPTPNKPARKKRRTLVDRYPAEPVIVHPTPEDHAVFVGDYSRAERRSKINSYRQKKLRRSKNFVRYRNRKRFADSRPRIGGRFVRMS